MDLSLVLADLLAIFRDFFLARARAHILAQFLTVLSQFAIITAKLLAIFPDLPTIIPQFSRVSAQLSTGTGSGNWPILQILPQIAPVFP